MAVAELAPTRRQERMAKAGGIARDARVRRMMRLALIGGGVAGAFFMSWNAFFAGAIGGALWAAGTRTRE